jgi:hypothetical protein
MLVVTQFHAGFWQGGFNDLTPDVRALRFPAWAPPPATAYDAYDVLSDMNGSGVGVGCGSWVCVTSYDDQNSYVTFGPVRRATLWPGDNRPPVDFGSLQDSSSVCESTFQAINESGDIVGVSALYDPQQPGAQITHAVRSRVSLASSPDGKLTDLGTLGGLYSAAESINNAGVAVGYSTVLPEDPITNSRAVYWLPGDLTPRRLPACGDDRLTYARSVNDDNRIVGDAVDCTGAQIAALWEPNLVTSDGLSYDLVDLNQLVHRSDWALFTARGINNRGLIVGSGYHATEVVLDTGARQSIVAPRVCALIPGVSLAVDYNRDGRIELNESDEVPPDLPYQFWVNDDSDDGIADAALGITDLPGAQAGLLELDGRTPDWADDKVNGLADLVDWFPVYLNISNLFSVFPPAQYEYRLAQADGALNFLYTNLKPDEAGSYLTNTLASGFGPDFCLPAESANRVQQVTPEGVPLSEEFLYNSATENRGVLLFEARQATTEPLRLDVVSAAGRVVTSVELPLQITGVESMYAWANLRPAAGEEAIRPADVFPCNWPFHADEDRAFVFVHGYNVNEWQARAWSAEMFKRLWWSGSNSRFYAVSWFGDDTQVAWQTTINYHVNVRHAFETAPVLALVLNKTLQGQEVTVAAHSLGNMIVCSAIEDYGARPGRFCMIDAAVAMEAFDAGLPSQEFMTHPDWLGYSNRLCASEWHQLFPETDGRRGLTWRGRFQDVPRLTQLYNFYSSGEEVLENRHDNADPWISDIASFQLQWPVLRMPVNTLIGRWAWTLQEIMKGRVTASEMTKLYAEGYTIGGTPAWLALHVANLGNSSILGSSYGGWGFNSYWDASGTLLRIDGGSTPTLLYLPGGHRPPDQAGALPDADVEVNPFFLPFPDPRLTTAEGGSLADDDSVRAQLLAEAIPARTFAAGGNRLEKPDHDPVAKLNFDMNSDLQKRGWPAKRLNSSQDKKRWEHSDIHNVPYQYTGMAFDELVQLDGGR